MSKSDQYTLTQDEAYDLLSNARRRYVISYLRSQDGPVHLSELSERIAAWENDVSIDELTDQQIKRIYVSLYQTHLPKLEDVRMIEYDQERGILTLRDEGEQLDAYLPTEESGESRWPIVYGILTILGLVLYLTGALVPLFPVSPTQLGGVIILTFVAVSIVHYLTQRN